MNNVSDLMPAAKRAIANTGNQPAPSVKDLAPEVKHQTALLINDLFEQLRAAYPAWKQAWNSKALYEKAKAEWTQGLMDAGITDWGLIERGIARCRQEPSDFIPSVGKFIERCWLTPAQIGAPDEEKAYWEAQRNSHPSMVGHERWSHNAVFHAATQCSRHSLLTLPSDVGRLKFAKAYAAVMVRVSQGELLADPAPALPMDLGRKGDPGKAAAALAAMRAAVGGVRI